MPSRLPENLVDAFLATHYRVQDGDRSFVLRIDQYSRELADLFRREQLSSAAYITACNPLSQPLSRQENEQAHQSLIKDLCRLGYRWLDGFGEDPSGKWAGEASMLVLGLDQPAASELGRRYQQNAIVWIGTDAIPRLMLLR